MNIKKRFTIISILLATIPVFIITRVSLANFKNKSMEIIRENITTVAKDQSIHLEKFFDEQLINLSIIANMPIVQQGLVASNNNVNFSDSTYEKNVLSRVLNIIKNEESCLNTIVLINKNKVNMASSNEEDIGKEMLITDNEMEKLINNQAVITDIIERENFNNGIKSAIIAKSIFINNQYEGTMMSIIDMSYFEKLVKEITFFKTGKIVIMDSKGNIASSTSEHLIDSINNISTPNTLYKVWNDIDFNKNPNGLIEYNIGGVDKIGYYSKIKNSEWIVLSAIEWNEFIAPIKESINSIIITVISICSVVVIAYIFIVNHFSKPIYQLLYSIRSIKKGDENTRFLYTKQNEFGEIAEAFNSLMDSVLKNKEELEYSNRKLESLTSNIPGGVYRCRLENEQYILDFISKGFLEFIGYNEETFKREFGNSLHNFISKKDAKRVRTEMNKQLQNSNKFEVEYRIKTRDGRILWILDNGQLIRNENGNPFIYSVVLNITDSKIAEEKLRLSRERYRIIMHQTEDIIFEWNILKDTLAYSENWNEKFDYELPTENVIKQIFYCGNIYKEDINKLKMIVNDIVNGEKYRECEVRIRKKDSNYIWCKIRVTTIFDENGKPLKGIGVIIDIDKEKKESENLLFMAQRDSLTELYNKLTSQTIIENYIKNSTSSEKHALFIIDIDDFKGINDKLGHLHGDSALKNISSKMAEVFNNDAIIGRIGGDEFIIFLNNVKSQKFISDKANELVKSFRESFTGENSEYKVSGSIGIAQYPQDGTTFEQLFLSADKALYIAKNKGKDNYCIYSKDIE